MNRAQFLQEIEAAKRRAATGAAPFGDAQQVPPEVTKATQSLRKLTTAMTYPHQNVALLPLPCTYDLLPCF